MATPRKRSTKAAEKKAVKIGEAVAVSVLVEATRDTPTYYVNHAQITYSEHEVALTFARTPTRPSRDELQEAEELGALIVDPEMQILIPPSLLPRLIDALEQIKTAYEATVGKIGRNDDAASS